MCQKGYENMNRRLYNEYLTTWINGLQDEIEFWDDYMRTEGGLSFYGFDVTTSPDRPFELENDIPRDMYGKEYKFIDVGSGPFSRCGHITDKVVLNAISVDPLAYAYIKLKKKYNIDNGIKLDNGFVEVLDKKYKSNTFDMVHMSNSLDHCFSAIDGIYQLLNICKIGGKVVLRHNENEALAEGYQGLHQWNLSLQNEEQSFIVWRDNIRYDICSIFGQYADIELYPNQREKGGVWIYNKVVMTKKRDIPLPSNNYYGDMLDVFYEKMLDDMMKLTRINQISRNEKKNSARVKINRIRECYHKLEKTKTNIDKRNIDAIIIYGMGYVGRNIDYLLKKCGIKATLLDRKGPNSGSKNAMTLEQCEDFTADVIILTINDKNVQEKLIDLCGSENKVILVDDFLEILEGA